MSDPTETIAELFAKDPLSLTREDVTEIVSYMRANREKFVASGQNGRTGRTQPATRPRKASNVPDLDLGDLEL